MGIFMGYVSFREGKGWWFDLGVGFKYLLIFNLLGEMIQFDEDIFEMGWNHQLYSDDLWW